MEYRLLGPVEVVHDGELVELGPRKQRALLCLLLLHANRVVTTDRILEELWGDDAAGKENALWVAISRLRTGLEPARDGHGGSTVLLTRDHGYMLRVEPGAIDVQRLEMAVAEARQLHQRDPSAAVRRLDEALGLFRGTPLEEFHHEQFTQLAIAGIEELRLEALELRAESELRLGHGREQINALEVLHEQHPLRERFVELLMRSLYQSGRHADALRVFDRHRRTLGEELGIAPSPELHRLEEQILLHDPSLNAGRSDPGSAAATVVNPFKGLRAFGEADAQDFFGRDRLVSETVRRIAAGQRLIALVGASGSGKSSVVHAGVVPAVRKGGIEGSDRWLVAQMVPGARPILELEAALLRSSLDSPDSLAEQLHDSDTGLLRAALRILPQDSRLVLVIDQFEELFTLVDDESERVRFLDLIGPALDDPHGRVVVVLTMRADFYDRPLVYPAFAERLGNGIVNVAVLTPDELERAAEEPMRQAEVAYEPSLMATLLTDVIGQPGALPLFQYTLTMLFDRRVDNVVTLEAYRAIGGLTGALAKRAEDLWSELDGEQAAAARQLFLRLVTISGERAWSRRRVVASELTSLRHDLVPTQRVVELFGAHRLLSFDRDQMTGSPTVEVAHEALLTEWPRLRDWIESARDDVVRHAALVTAMSEWQAAGLNADYLLVGRRLTDYEAWAGHSTLDLTEHEHEYLRRSVAARDDADRDETERSARELALAKGVRRRTAAFLLLVLALVIGGGAVWFAARGGDVPNIAYFALPGPIDVFASQERAGWEQAQRELDFDGELVIPLSDAREELASLADTAPDLIVVGFATAGDSWALEAATNHPDVRFVVFESLPSDWNLPNVTVVHPSDVAAGAFLAGAAAALTSQTGTVGFLGAHQPITEPFRSGFEAGARAADPEVRIVTTVLTQTGRTDVFLDAAGGQAAARALYEQGADVVFAAAGGAGASFPQVAEEMSDELGRHLWTIGVDVDEWLTASTSEREHVLTSLLKRHDRIVGTALDRYLAGDLDPGVVGVGMEDGIYSLSESGGHLDGATLERLGAIEDGLARGTTTVSDVPSDGPTVLQPAEHTVTVTWTGAECIADAPPTIELGSSFRVDFYNTSGDVASAALYQNGFDSFRLDAQAGATNSGVVEPSYEAAWSIACTEAESFVPIAEAGGFNVVT